MSGRREAPKSAVARMAGEVRFMAVAGAWMMVVVTGPLRNPLCWSRE